MPEDEAWNSSHELSQEDQGQKHGILRNTKDKKQSCKVISETGNVSYCSFTDQFEHPRAATACGEAAEQSEDNDDGSGPDEDIWRVGALLSSQGEKGLQAYLPPHANGQQDHACDLETTEERVSSSIKDQQRNARKAFRTCDWYGPRPTSYLRVWLAFRNTIISFQFIM